MDTDQYKKTLVDVSTKELAESLLYDFNKIRNNPVCNKHLTFTDEEFDKMVKLVTEIRDEGDVNGNG